MPEKRLHYDCIISLFEKSIEMVEKCRSAGTPIPKNIKNRIESDKIMLKSLRDVKIFWIDELTLESLLNEPYQVAGFLKEEYKTPFSQMFIDFEKGLEYRFLEKREESTKNKIGGITFFVNEYNNFAINAFRNDGEGPLISMWYTHTNAAPMIISEKQFNKEGSASEMRNYLFKIQEKKIFRPTVKVPPEKLIKMRGSPLEDFLEIGSPINYQMVDDDCLDAFKLTNFSINIIDYINTANVVIRERKRFRKERFRIGVGKDRHLEKRKVELKPYYWVEIKKGYVDKEHEDSGKTLDFRFWVRGHFRKLESERYKSKRGQKIWITPYVKGPEDAPWKENRWEILYKRFEHILKNPKLMEG